MNIVLIESRGTSKFMHNGLAYLAGALGEKGKHKIRILI